MKKFLSLFDLRNFKEDMKRILKRFPFSILMILGLCTVFLVNLHADLNPYASDKLLKGALSIVNTFFLGLGVYLISESYRLKESRKLILQLLVLLAGFFYYTGFRDGYSESESATYFILTFVGIISFLYMAPFFKRLVDKQDINKSYYSYFYKISVIFLISAILGGVLFALGSIGITAIFSLFDIRDIVSEKVYGDWMIISASLITPIFALTRVPDVNDSEDPTENKFFAFLIKYIGIPFIVIYFLILYSYSIKVLMNFKDWPRGEVTWLVIGFSVFGYIIHIFSQSFEKFEYIRLFRKLFPYFVIPQLLMLFYAIYLRIAQYDLTMNRYMVVVFGIWLAFISFYMIFSVKKNVAHLISSLMILIIIISIGPWGVYSLPESRQYSRLETELKKAGILKDGKIIPLKNYSDKDPELSKEIYQGIDYLCGVKDCGSIKRLFAEQLKNPNVKVNDYGTISVIGDDTKSWEIVSIIADKIKVRSNLSSEDYSGSTLSFYTKYRDLYPLDVAGYKQVINFTTSEDTKHAEYSQDGDEMLIKEGTTIIDRVSLKPVIDRILGSYKKYKTLEMSYGDMTFDLKGGKGEYRISLQNIDLKNPDYKGNDKRPYLNINGIVLIK